MYVREMTSQQSVVLVSTCHVGRLACARENRPYVVPIHYAYAENHLYSFSMPGQKIEWMRTNPNVCVQIDEFTGQRGWQSVVVYGTYEELTDTPRLQVRRDHAWFLLQQHVNWWEPGGLKPTPQPMTDSSPHLFYRIRIESMTGRQGVDDQNGRPRAI